jgi:hypothetical protein
MAQTELQLQEVVAVVQVVMALLLGEQAALVS